MSPVYYSSVQGPEALGLVAVFPSTGAASSVAIGLWWLVDAFGESALIAVALVGHGVKRELSFSD